MTIRKAVRSLSLRYPGWRVKIWTNDKWSIDSGATALSGSQGIADHRDIVLSTYLTSVFCSKLGKIFILKLWYVTANRVRQSKIQRGEKLNSFEILVFLRKRTLKFLQVEDVLLHQFHHPRIYGCVHASYFPFPPHVNT